MGFETPHLRGCRSYHFEASVPREFEIHDERLHADIRNSSDPSSSRPVVLFKSFSADLHLYVDLFGTQTLDSGGVSFKVRPGRRGFLSFALWAALLITAMLWVMFALHDNLQDDPASQAIPPMLLLIPAVLVAIVNRPEDHPFSAFLLTGTRYMILLSGVAASAAAGVLAFVEVPANSDALSITWLSASIVSSVVAILILVGWIASLPTRGRGAAWALVSGVVGLALAGYALFADAWGGFMIHALLLIALVVAQCTRIALRPPEDLPPERRYFRPDLLASGVLAPESRNNGGTRWDS